ncbi:MAG: hypothetical protein H0W73_03905 [Bacteroidetes bacterium]|nr:hypothetical protein [Bacteroidota bacterium]
MKRLIFTKLFFILFITASAQWSTIYNIGSDFFYTTRFINKNIGFCGGVSEIIKTTNGGSSWTSFPVPMSSIESIYFLNKDTGYAVGGTAMGSLGLILRTTDAGVNWVTQSSTISSPLYSVHFATKDTGYAVGLTGVIVRTTDAGATWVAQTSGVTVFMTTVYFTSSTTGYAVGYNGTILKTINSGQNWILQNSGTNANLIGVKFTSNNIGYVCGGLMPNTPVLLKTLNAGASWAPQTIPVGIGNLHNFSFLNSNEAYVVGENGAILHTNNAGASWGTANFRGFRKII